MSKKTIISFTLEEWDKMLKIADEMMKASNGHEFETILKTRCIHCRRSPKVKTRCGGWFMTFIHKLELVMLNKESYLCPTKKKQKI